MKFTVSRKALVAALNTISFAVPTRKTPDILKAVRIEAGPGGVTFATCDLEAYAEYTVSCEVEEPGAIATEHSALLVLVRSLTGDLVTVTLTNPRTLEISTSGVTVPLSGMDAEGFPRCPRIALRKLGEAWEETSINGVRSTLTVLDTFTEQATVLTQTLVEAARHVQYIPDHLNEPVYAGIALFLEDETLTLVGADSFRMSHAAVKAPGAAFWKHSLLIPVRPLRLALKKLLKGDCDICTVYNTTQKQKVEEDTTAVVTTEATFTTLNTGPLTVDIRLIAAQYPNWRALEPRAFPTCMTVDAGDLKHALQALTLVAQANANNLQVQILEVPEKGKVFRFEGQQEGVQKPTQVDVPVAVEGENIALRLNWQYLRELTNVLKGRLTFHFSGVRTPVKVAEMSYPTHAALFMPMQEPA